MFELEFDNLWTRYMGRDVTPAAYAAEGWDKARILADLRELWGNHPTEALYNAELADIANRLTAGLEARGLGPTAPAAAYETLTLTTAHAASSYKQPVLLIDGQPFGPADLTPDGTPAAIAVTDLAAAFIHPLAPEARAAVWRSAGADPVGALAPQMLDLLLQMLELYDGKRLAPPEYFASYWQDLRDMLRQAEALP